MSYSRWLSCEMRSLDRVEPACCIARRRAPGQNAPRRLSITLLCRPPCVVRHRRRVVIIPAEKHLHRFQDGLELVELLLQHPSARSLNVVFSTFSAGHRDQQPHHAIARSFEQPALFARARSPSLTARASRTSSAICSTERLGDGQRRPQAAGVAAADVDDNVIVLWRELPDLGS